MIEVPSWAKPGVKVVCIFDEWKRGKLSLVEWGWLKARGLPRKGEVYTIEAVGRHRYDARASLHLKGWGRRYHFHADFFRPLVEPKTEAEDMAVFRKLLEVPATTKVTEVSE